MTRAEIETHPEDLARAEIERRLLAQCIAIRRVMTEDEAERLRRLAAGQDTGGFYGAAWRPQLRTLQRALVRLRRERGARARA